MTRANQRYDLLRRSVFVTGCLCGCGWRGPSVRRLDTTDPATGDKTATYLVDSGTHIVTTTARLSDAETELTRWTHTGRWED